MKFNLHEIDLLELKIYTFFIFTYKVMLRY